MEHHTHFDYSSTVAPRSSYKPESRPFFQARGTTGSSESIHYDNINLFLPRICEFLINIAKQLVGCFGCLAHAQYSDPPDQYRNMVAENTTIRPVVLRSD